MGSVESLLDRPGSTLDRSRSYLREHGLLSFCLAAVDVALPEPYGTGFRAWRAVILDVLTSDALSVADSVTAIRHGFTTDLYRLYSLDRCGDPALYLDDVSRRRAKYVNDQPEALDDKRRFHRYLRDNGFDEVLPTVHGHIEGGRFHSDSYRSLQAVLADHDRVVIKRRTGAAGNNVYICSSTESDPVVGEDGHLLLDPERRVGDFEDHLVTEYCEQAAYARALYPHAANTVRVLTLRSGETIHVAAAVQRIGSAETGVLDNFSRGGLSAAIDLDTGELGTAAEPSSEGPNWHDIHPDTGAAIAGRTIPGWPEILSRLRTIVRETTAFRHVGWDILVTGPGEFVIIEGNSFPDPDVIQVHEPLLAQEPVWRFYDAHGVI